jgi:glutamate dehydrogenase
MRRQSEPTRRVVDEILDHLVEAAVRRCPSEPLLAEFLPRYYREHLESDVDDHRLDDLYAVAAAHFALGRCRGRGETLVEVVSPDADRDGWNSPHSFLLVVTDDAPFLVDTMRIVLDRHAFGTHRVVHPMLVVERSEGGDIGSFDGATGCLEAWTQIEIDRCDAATAIDLANEIRSVVEEVHLAVHDFDSMRSWMASLSSEDPLLAWFASGHFVLLGAATYDRTADGGLTVRGGTELGQLRRPHEIDPPAVPVEISDGTPVLISRSDAISTIHRASRRVCVSVRAGGGARHRFIGLLASSAYRQSVMSIPTIGDRAREVVSRSDAPDDSHTKRSMRNVLESLPRDVLFELDADRLSHLVFEIVGLQERRLVRVFDVPEPVGEWSTVMVYLPRSRFASHVPERVATAVASAYGSRFRSLEFLVGSSSLARITFTVRRPAPETMPDLDRLGRQIDELTTSWMERLRTELEHQLGGSDSRRLLDRLTPAIPPEYSASVTPARAVGDLVRIDGLVASDRALATAMSREVDDPVGEWRFRVYRRGAPAVLAELLPLLDHLGLDALDERPYTFRFDDEEVHLYDIGVRASVGELDVSRHPEVMATFESLVSGEVEADGLNRLVTVAGLSSSQVAVIRAYAKYLRQIGFSFSQSYIEDTLSRLAPVAGYLIELFEARFDPFVDDRAAAVDSARARLNEALDRIQVLDDDRICRAFVNLIDATTRTSAFTPTTTVAFKFDPRSIPEMPRPCPRFEIFVCSPRVEAVHLRAGAVARGGLRWSDRRQDFRTEVLGLVKAQMVKNAVIVPVGAKGGFVVKRPPDDPIELRAEVVSCYRDFVGAMLDLTDNIIDGEVVQPAHMVIYDEPDPYLVVAADKGTATFSDIANEISVAAGFWLGDAFASGGSAGYDHKAMGITARGAWESVRRHARAIGKDVEVDPITAVGVGDMSGDVFGNGMLLSPHLRLIAAFDHRHIFIDPDPGSAAFGERLRLFDLPRSSWDDYDPALISAGGGVYSRAVKSINLSPQARAVLGVDAEHLTPIEVIKAILSAPVDLLWNGGIGTYVKASSETHAGVGDRANDAVRVDACDLRCRIIGEGGNLGVTQLGRIEFALAGGLVNTDAIDNSAGVDCSDHEVNIKILLDEVVAAGRLTSKQRDELLASMTDEVAELVLANNRAQTLALSIARRQALPMVSVHARYLTLLEAEGWLDRSLEFLPSDKHLAERQAAGLGLQTPEFAVMIAYTKNANVTEVLQSDLPDDPVLFDDLVRYFPTPLRERYPEMIRSHQLRREIVATRVVNQMVNLSGISYDHRMTEDTGASVTDVTRAWVATREIIDFAQVWSDVDALGSSVDLDTQLELFLDARWTAERCSLWLLRNRRPPLDMSRTIETFREPVRWLAEHLHAALTGPMADTVAATVEARVGVGVPARLAHRSAVWKLLHTGFDMAQIAHTSGASLADVARVYWQVFDRLELMWLWTGIGALPRADRWQTHARSALRDDLLSALAGLAQTVVIDCRGSVDDWVAANERAVSRTAGMLTEIRRTESTDLTTLSVALRQLRNLAFTSVQPLHGEAV